MGAVVVAAIVLVTLVIGAIGAGVVVYSRRAEVKACDLATTPTANRIQACAAVCKRDGQRVDACATQGRLVAAGGTKSALEEGLRILEAACEKHDAGACGDVAELSAFPPNAVVLPDPKKAAGFARRACDAAPSQCALLGVASELGWSAEIHDDPMSAYERACTAGGVDGCVFQALSSKQISPPSETDPTAGARKKALEALEPRCAAADPKACAFAGALVDGEPAKAVPLYRKGCDAGNALACNNLAIALAEGRTGPANPLAALPLFEKACEGGELAGCNNAGAMKSGLSMVHRRGPRGALVYKLRCQRAFNTGCAGWGDPIHPWPGSPGDLKEAVRQFQRACDGGLQTACVTLGGFLVVGQGLPKNRKKGEELFDRACDSGDPGGCGESATMTNTDFMGRPSNHTKGAALMKKACVGGEQDACAFYNSLLADGVGVTASPAEAVAALKKLCDANVQQACGVAADFAVEGIGMPKDQTEGRRLYAKACAEGEGVHCDRYAGILFNGFGGPKERERSQTILERACSNDRLEACRRLAFRYTDGILVKRDPARAAQMLEKNCGLGDPISCNALSHAYVAGEGVAADPTRGARLAHESCDDGYRPACGTYGILVATGVGEPKNVEKAKPFLVHACRYEVKQACAQLKELGLEVPASALR